MGEGSVRLSSAWRGIDAAAATYHRHHEQEAKGRRRQHHDHPGGQLNDRRGLCWLAFAGLVHEGSDAAAHEVPGNVHGQLQSTVMVMIVMKRR
jgi:hypothetical protein